MARNPRSRASKAGNRKALEMVREDMMDLPEGPEEVAALPEGLGPQTKFLGTDERGLPTVGTATPAQVSEAAATYAEKLKDKPGFEEAARVTAEGRLPGMDAPPEPAEAKAEDKLDVKPMNWTGYGGFEYSVDPARPGQIKINGKLFTDEQLRANTRKRGKEVGISDILLEKTDIENKGIKIAPKAKETPTARRRRIAEQALAPSAPTPALEEFPQSDASEEFMTGAGAMPAAQGPSLQEAFAETEPNVPSASVPRYLPKGLDSDGDGTVSPAEYSALDTDGDGMVSTTESLAEASATPAPEVTQEEQRPPERTKKEAFAARLEAASNVPMTRRQAERVIDMMLEAEYLEERYRGGGSNEKINQEYRDLLEDLGLGASDFPNAKASIGVEQNDESPTSSGNEVFNTLKRKATAILQPRAVKQRRDSYNLANLFRIY